VTVSFTLWRIASETKQYKANDLSGGGAAKYPGRWNASGEYVVYAARSIALAVLETAAHVESSGLPLNRFVVKITLPLKVWTARQELKLSEIDPAWSAVPAGKASVDIGSNWYKSGASALLLVPSVIVPEEHAVLINATHPDAKVVKAKTIRPFEFNKLFRK
jgi:RES domain-containing protein